MPACLPACVHCLCGVVPPSLDLATASKVATGWETRLEELAWQNEVRQGSSGLNLMYLLG